MTDQEVKKFKHEDSGYHWERKKVRIKIEAWKDEEVKEKTSFDPFSDKECPECGRPLSLKKGVKYCSHCGWNKDAPIFDEIKLQD